MESPSHFHVGRRLPLRKPAQLPNVIETQPERCAVAAVAWTVGGICGAALFVWGLATFGDALRAWLGLA